MHHEKRKRHQFIINEDCGTMVSNLKSERPNGKCRSRHGSSPMATLLCCPIDRGAGYLTPAPNPSHYYILSTTIADLSHHTSHSIYKFLSLVLSPTPKCPGSEMGNGQPYLYDPPSRYSVVDPFNGGFNPKAVTMASYSTPPPSPPKSKHEGPLLNFNRHPDSYLILPGRQDPVPLSSGTKSRIIWTRKIQQAFRLLELVGAIGMLVCAVCIRGMTDAESVVLRVAVS
jgi:hypothetical protein